MGQDRQEGCDQADAELIDDFIDFYNYERIQLKTGVALNSGALVLSMGGAHSLSNILLVGYDGLNGILQRF